MLLLVTYGLPLHTLFDYIAKREPDMLGVCQQVAAIPMKRAAPAGQGGPRRP